MSGCCWRPISQQIGARGGSAPRVGGNGVIPLNGYDDSTGYTDTGRNQTVYLVGWGTEHEKIFAGTDAKRAVAYRNKTNTDLVITPVQAQELPADAVAELLASSA
jgi:hypothetical protein